MTPQIATMLANPRDALPSHAPRPADQHVRGQEREKRKRRQDVEGELRSDDLEHQPGSDDRAEREANRGKMPSAPCAYDRRGKEQTPREEPRPDQHEIKPRRAAVSLLRRTHAIDHFMTNRGGEKSRTTQVDQDKPGSADDREDDDAENRASVFPPGEVFRRDRRWQGRASW